MQEVSGSIPLGSTIIPQKTKNTRALAPRCGGFHGRPVKGNGAHGFPRTPQTVQTMLRKFRL
jgi:hypothetical protein